MLSQKNRYLSVLKQKAGEMDAVHDLDAGIWDQWNPLFELLASDLDEPGTLKESEGLVGGAVHKISAACKTGATIFIDFDGMELINGQASGVVARILSAAQERGLTPIPVIGIGSTSEVLQGVRDYLAKEEPTVAIRLHMAEVSPLLSQQVDTLLKVTGADVQQGHLLFDLEFVPFDQVQPLAVTLPLLIPTLPQITSWGTVTLIGTGVPKVLDIASASTADLPRSDWALFKAVHGSLSKIVKRLDFGDYAVSNPVLVDFDPEKMQVCPKILYASSTSWMTYKGRSTKREGWGQTQGMCQELVKCTEFKGAQFSSGDAYIEDCARGQVSSGNARTWKKVGTNHHITFVAEQVANLIGA